MKKLFRILLLLLSFTISFSSCEDSYDDSAIRNEIDNINGEIGDIKTELDALKKQIISVESIVNALNEEKVITNIEELSDGKGYKITFNDATTIEVLRGGNASAISIQEVEGVYYWTVITNGKADFLYDSEGNKVAVATSSSAFSFDKEGYWTLNDKRITDANDDFIRFSKTNTDAFFTDIIVNETSVIFVLADESRIVIPKTTKTVLAFVGDSDTPFYLLKLNGRATNLSFSYSSDLKNIEVVGQPEGWRTNIHLPGKYVAVTPAADAVCGIGEIRLQATDKNGLIYLAIAKVSVEGSGFDNPDGVYVLNEGNMTTENGSLIYIDPTGKIMDGVYQAMNGSQLGNVAQDLYICGNKIYIISQNGSKNPIGTSFKNDGMLVVANSGTMKKITSYTEELGADMATDWPTHIAVLDDENIFLRSNKGVSLFNSVSNEMKLIEGTEGAKKTTMAVANGMVFVSGGTKLFVLEKNKAQVSHVIDMGATISGVIKSSDGNIWVSTLQATGKTAQISKINSQTYAITKSNNVTECSLSAGMAATPAITAKDNILYYSGLNSKIYRHNFDTGVTELMVDVKKLSGVSNVGIVYNTVAVHPRTEKVYLNSIKGYGWDFVINNITVLKPSADGNSLELDENYENHTHFPAGIFFPANFQ